MTGSADEGKDGGREQAAGTAPKPRDPRAERLAAQLKANLKRRKEQARGRAAGEDQAG
jgi:hypothetical protein